MLKSPELSDGKLDDIQFYLSALFVSLPIASTETLQHGAASQTRTINPYSDLLLHDMGEGLADHRPDFAANGREWRTPPLWGIGLAKTVHPDAGFLHDGRARTLQEAILWHDGEANTAKERFRKLTPEERKLLLLFLESL